MNKLKSIRLRALWSQCRKRHFLEIDKPTYFTMIDEAEEIWTDDRGTLLLCDEKITAFRQGDKYFARDDYDPVSLGRNAVSIDSKSTTLIGGLVEQERTDLRERGTQRSVLSVPNLR